MLCEFIDTEWYEPWPDPPAPPVELFKQDPWRGAHRDVFLVPRAIVEDAVQVNWMRDVERTEAWKIEELAADIEVNGLRTPLLLSVDRDGRLILHHGHHRTAATRRWAWFDWLPVQVQLSERIRIHKPARVQDHILELMRRACPEEWLDRGFDPRLEGGMP